MIQNYSSKFITGAKDDTETHIYARDKCVLQTFKQGPKANHFKNAYL